MKKTKVKMGKREVILESAVKVFSGKGYHNTRMEEIAATAGIGKGTIYEYFDSKLQLFQAMMENSLEVYYESLDAENSPVTFAERIYYLSDAHFKFCQDNKELTRIVFWDAEIFDEELKEWCDNVRKKKQERMSEIIEAAVLAGEIRNIEPKLLTAVITGIFGAMWAPIVLDGWEIDSSDLARQVTDIIMNGIGISDY